MSPFSAALCQGLGTVLYLALAGLAWTGPRHQPAAPRRALAAGCLAMAGWSATTAVVWLVPELPETLVDLTEATRTVVWLYLLAGCVDSRHGPDDTSRRLLTGRVLLAGLAGFALLTLLAGFALPAGSAHRLSPLADAVLLVASVSGLALAEKAFSLSGPAGRWGLKHLLLALATLFGSDIFFHADSLLLANAPQDGETALTRALIPLLIAPLFAISRVRIASWARPGDPAGSAGGRSASLRGMALVGSGLYLMVMAVIAFVVREIGGEWGPPLRIVFMVGVFLAMALALSSGRFIAGAKVYLHQTFFTYKYDYREEWRRFIGMMSAHHPLPLADRILHALADMLDSPAGALWVWHEADDAFIPESKWNYHGATPSERADSPFIAALRERDWIVEITGTGRSDPPLPLPPFLTGHASAWLVVPLLHRGGLLAFLVLDQPRARRRIDWEDRDLIKTAAAHGASHLAEEKAAEALRDARLFQDFNRRFAFVAHDIKTVVGQMSLMLDNAARFGDNPAFQRDMIETVRNSTARMKTLLEQINEKRRPPATTAVADLGQIAAQVVERWRKTSPQLHLDREDGPYPVAASEEKLVSILDLLIDNALGAIAPGGRVDLRLRHEPAGVRLEVADDGAGMDPDFVRHDLFRPLRSTKSNGYGLGAYQTRHLIRELGGHLEVETAPSRGTTMCVRLPIAATAAAPSC